MRLVECSHDTWHNCVEMPYQICMMNAMPCCFLSPLRLAQSLRLQQPDSPSSPSPDEHFHLPRSASLGQGKTSSLKKLKKVVTRRLRNSISISGGMSPSGSVPSESILQKTIIVQQLRKLHFAHAFSYWQKVKIVASFPGILLRSRVKGRLSKSWNRTEVAREWD